MKFVSVIVSFSLLVASCTYKKQEVGPHKSISSSMPCADSTYSSYALSVKPMMETYCYSCHNTNVTGAGALGLDLENFTSFKNYLTLDFKGNGQYGSLFYNCVLKTQGAKAMPPDYTLTSCELNRIKRWIEAGAPNN